MRMMTTWLSSLGPASLTDAVSLGWAAGAAPLAAAALTGATAAAGAAAGADAAGVLWVSGDGFFGLFPVSTDDLTLAFCLPESANKDLMFI